MENQFKIFDREGCPLSFSSEEKAFREWCSYVKSLNLLIKKQKTEYYNIACSFDIETTSFEDSKGKHATRYAFVIGVHGKVFIGRTWHDFIKYLGDLSEIFGLNPQKRLVIYVHNLAFEFQFIRKMLNWSKVFSIDEREVIYAETEQGIDFRCSYKLSNLSLAKVGENLTKYKIGKMVGDLDYNVKRGSTSPLTEKEWKYIYHDGLVVMAYIQEEIEKNGGITEIPNTATGYVRREVRDNCRHEKDNKKKSELKYKRYTALRRSLTRTPEEYQLAKNAFSGGFTHANMLHCGEVCENVQSMDFTSSYPAVRVAEQYPRSKGRKVKISFVEQLKELAKSKLLMFVAHFKGLESRYVGDNYLSFSKCLECDKKAILDNGRIMESKDLITCLTSIDLEIMEKCYTWDSLEIGLCYVYDKGYLPSSFVRSILDFYKAKTTLKGVAGKEAEYRAGKAMLNSCYGMCVTDICRSEITYKENRWGTIPVDFDKDIAKYNKSKGRFLSYIWGVFVTAYARRNLWKGILELGEDYIYSDTDSVKYRNAKEHEKFFEDYNNEIREKLIKACKYHGFSPEEIEPKTIKGVKKTLGVWDFDGFYKRFKTLGAKRYRVEKENGERAITIAGVGKVSGRNYLRYRYVTNDKIFKAFSHGLVFPATYIDTGEIKEGCGKELHTYIDEEEEGTFRDYQNNIQHYHELSSINLQPTTYRLSRSQDYRELLTKVRYR